MTMTRAALIGAALAWTSWSHAADLGSGTLNLAETTIQVSGGPVVGTNAGDAAGARCIDPVFPCDTFTLTVELPEDVSEFFPTALVRVTMQPEDNPSTADDYDLFLYDDAGNELASSTSPGGTEGVSTIAFGGSRGYLVEFVHWLVVGGTWSGEMTLSLGAPSEDKTDEEIAAWLEENGGSTEAAARAAEACTMPGTVLLTDNSGDVNPLGIVPGAALPIPDFDLTEMSVFQVGSTEGPDDPSLIAFSMQVGGLETLGTLVPNSAYFISFSPAATGSIFGVRMAVDDQGSPTFFSYLAGPNNDGGIDGRFVEDGTERPAAPQSYYDASGEIVIFVKPQDIGLLGPGEQLTGFNAASIFGAGVPGVGGVAGTMDEMPDGLGRAGIYTYLSDEDCGADAVAAASRGIGSDLRGGATGLWLLVLAGLLGLRRR